MGLFLLTLLLSLRAMHDFAKSIKYGAPKYAPLLACFSMHPGALSPLLLDFSLLPSLYTSIPHFAIEESAVTPSVLSKYGVYGLPALFLMKSTVRVRYHGSRTPASLMSYYADIAGIKIAAVDILAKGKTGNLPLDTKLETHAFTWARSSSHIHQREALATLFVLLRLLYFILPSVLLFAHFALGNNPSSLRLGRVWELSAYLNKAKHFLAHLRSLLRGGIYKE